MEKFNEIVRAICENKKEIFFSLIESNPDLIEEVTEAIIEEKSDKLGWVKEKYGISLIHHVAAFGHWEILNKLLQHKPGLCRLKERENLTPIHWAATEGRIANFIIIRSVCPEAMQDVTALGRTVLSITLQHNHCVALEWLLRELSPTNLKHLLNQTDPYGDTLLHLAASMKNRRALRALLPMVENVNATNSLGLTALDLLFRSQYNERRDGDIMEILQGAGVTSRRQRAIAQAQAQAQAQPQPQAQPGWDFNEALQRFMLQIPLEMWPFVFLVVEILMQFVIQVASTSAAIFTLEYSKWNSTSTTSISGHPAYHIKDVILGHDAPSSVFYLMTFLTLAMIVAFLFSISFLSMLHMGRFLVVALLAILISYGILTATSMPRFFVIIIGGNLHISIAWLTWFTAICLLLLVALAKHIVVLLARFAVLFWKAIKGMVRGIGVAWNAFKRMMDVVWKAIKRKVLGRGRPVPNVLGNP